MEDDLGLAERSLYRLLGSEDLRKLLKSATTRLNVEEIDEGEFEDVPEDEEEVVLPDQLACPLQ